ncbi:hypothetical protein B0A49_11357 [Cryomyces minteri]|uniref:Uncharacterized protein n=1 Tax=Cryomyces minteri TaxID=331657 RepID=A0A4U0WC44_9PEZI|nr:hypothetical protein B0A49_11357 [Cryomyces minteri]
MIGLAQHNDHIIDTSFDILALEALFLIPRLCSLLSLIPYFGTLIPCLKEMTKDFIKFLSLVVILYLELDPAGSSAIEAHRLSRAAAKRTHSLAQDHTLSPRLPDIGVRAWAPIARRPSQDSVDLGLVDGWSRFFDGTACGVVDARTTRAVGIHLSASAAVLKLSAQVEELTNIVVAGQRSRHQSAESAEQ